MEARPEKTKKASRINIRASARQKSVLKEAARLQQTTMSDFVLENAVKAAQEVVARERLADQTLFLLPRKQWDAFCAALEAPAKPKPRLKRLLTEAGLFDE